MTAPSPAFFTTMERLSAERVKYLSPARRTPLALIASRFANAETIDFCSSGLSCHKKKSQEDRYFIDQLLYTLNRLEVAQTPPFWPRIAALEILPVPIRLESTYA